MSLLSRFFGRSKSSDKPSPSQTVEYQGFQILAEPMKEGSRFRISARITKTIAGTERQHHLIRADTLESYADAVEASVAKAKIMIDQQGDRIF